MSIRGIRFKYFAAAIAIVAILGGIWLTFFHSRGFVRTTATIVSIERDFSLPGDEDNYIVTVEYVADGSYHIEVLDSYSPSYQVGKTIRVRYDPKNPAVVHASDWMGVYFMVVGGVILAAVGITSLRARRALGDLREERPETRYAPSVRGEERHLYFFTDQGTAKFGHRIEDREGRVLYEAKVTKFTLAAPTGFDFIDHEHGRTTAHLIGHTEDSEWDTLLIDNHSTFTFDGEDIWKHLKRNGIRVDSSFMEGKPLWPQYRIFRDDVELARVESCGAYPHEEDAETRGKLAKLVPVRGYYRIWTREENLDLLFVTILAFARSSANDDRGGNYGHLFPKKR